MVVRTLLITGLLLLFSGCIPKQDDVKDAFQSSSANIIKNDYKSLKKLLISFKDKLDKRNPNDYSKALSPKIYNLIDSLNGRLYLKYKNNILDDYKDYLQIAFSKDEITARNDYLILGIYYLIYQSYDIESGYKIIALEYEKEKLHKLYKNLQIIRWKLKVDRDFNGDYLFTTWQNNWQVELDKKIRKDEIITYETIKNLHYIKTNKETILDHSNFSFEVILTQMIDRVENSLRALGEEPKNLSVTALRSVFLFF